MKRTQYRGYYRRYGREQINWYKFLFLGGGGAEPPFKLPNFYNSGKKDTAQRQSTVNKLKRKDCRVVKSSTGPSTLLHASSKGTTIYTTTGQ